MPGLLPTTKCSIPPAAATFLEPLAPSEQSTASLGTSGFMARSSVTPVRLGRRWKRRAPPRSATVRMGSCHFERPRIIFSPCVVKSSLLGRGGGATVYGFVTCRAHSREPSRDSRWKVSSASTIPEKPTAGLLPMMENQHPPVPDRVFAQSQPPRELAHRLRCGSAQHIPQRDHEQVRAMKSADGATRSARIGLLQPVQR